jgi:hypothetical protein
LILRYGAPVISMGSWVVSLKFVPKKRELTGLQQGLPLKGVTEAMGQLVLFERPPELTVSPGDHKEADA